MKQLSIGLVLLIVIISSCQKSGKDVTNSNTSSSPAATPPAPPPAANFKITSTLIPGVNNVKEGQTMVFDNSSKNGESYYWDFGNGTYSTQKSPSDITLWPCQNTLTIKLTVTNKDGQTDTHSEDYFVVCYRSAGGKIGPMPEQWPKH